MMSILVGLLLLLCPLSWLLIGAESTEMLPPAIEAPAPQLSAMTMIAGEGYEGVILFQDQFPDLALYSGIAMESYWFPLPEDIAVLEQALPEFIAANQDQFRRDIVTDLPNYARQCAGYYVNAICDHGEGFDWYVYCL